MSGGVDGDGLGFRPESFSANFVFVYLEGDAGFRGEGFAVAERSPRLKREREQERPLAQKRRSA